MGSERPSQLTQVTLTGEDDDGWSRKAALAMQAKAHLESYFDAKETSHLKMCIEYMREVLGLDTMTETEHSEHARDWAIIGKAHLLLFHTNTPTKDKDLEESLRYLHRGLDCVAKYPYEGSMRSFLLEHLWQAYGARYMNTPDPSPSDADMMIFFSTRES